MSRLTYDTKLPEETITAAGTNSVFAALADNTDGTSGDVDGTNLRDGAFVSKHLTTSQPHQELGTVDQGSVSSGTSYGSGTSGAATSWVDIADADLDSPVAVAEGDIVRWMFNPLVGEGVSSGNTPAGTKAQQVYYWRVLLKYNTGGGTLTTVIQQPMGYGLKTRSGNDASISGADGDNATSWCRNALTGIWINRGNAWTIEGVRLQFRWAVNDGTAAANTIDVCHVNGAVVAERM